MLALFVMMLTNCATAADRTRLVIPISADSPSEIMSGGRSPNQRFLDGRDRAWEAYVQLWKAHAADPADASIRRFLGLSLDGTIEIKSSVGRSAPGFLKWSRGSYQQYDTAHFVIYSQASEVDSRQLAEDLERCFWVWTQMFFPLWEGSSQVAVTFENWDRSTSLAAHLKRRSSRLSTRQKMRVVLFKDQQEYVTSLSRQVPGIEQSTGFYSDQARTTFLFAGHQETAATRRHELTHQLFREATRSQRSRPGDPASMPGDESGFWLIEGIAGYFESLAFDENSATLGGWDSSRLQYARFRVLANGEFISLQELDPEGREAVQQRTDLARWYAHAIAHTHRLVDGDTPADFEWLLRRLAELYRIDLSRVESGMTGPSDRDTPTAAHDAIATATLAKLRDFLIVDDQHLHNNPTQRPLRRLCLTHCEVTDDGLRTIASSPELQWLDLTRLPVQSAAVIRLVASPGSLEQLSLERTRIDSRLQALLAQATNLQELDLSFTAADDALLNAATAQKSLQTVWLTGSQISDATIDVLETLPNLQAVDVQRTAVTEERLERFKASRPAVDVNPIQIRTR